MSFSYSVFWSDIYYESIVEHDHRLRSICTKTPWINFDDIVDVDWVAAKNDDRIASHPIGIYLNKLAPKSQKFEKINKDLIYKRPRPVRVSFTTDTGVFDPDKERGSRYERGLNACSMIRINPRNRWFKLYERNPRFTSTISALSTQLNRAIQARSPNTKSASAETISRSIMIPMDTHLKYYKVRIYHRQAWNPMKEGTSFPLIWKEPDPSSSVDDVSGVALRHITLLCRDVICECNKCTMGCPSRVLSKPMCDVCLLEPQENNLRVDPSHLYSGSFAEGCMLPTFYVWNEMNEAIKKMSDIDEMVDSEGLVGFSADNESNIFATIEMENCKPGYLRLRVVGDGRILRSLEKSESFENSVQLRTIRSLKQTAEQRHFKQSFTRGPATTKIPYDGKPDEDYVDYYSCSSWPPIAQRWIDRERQSRWPSNELIQEIVSKGCRIVHKSHPSTCSTDSDGEFRFSFSVAERILFGAMSVDQKKCFIAFKALVKYRVYISEHITNHKIDLISTYHLKTIFLWTCETIPADQWQTTTGWARCFLYMIEQFYSCLVSRTLPAISSRNAISWTRSNQRRPSLMKSGNYKAIQ